MIFPPLLVLPVWMIPAACVCVFLCVWVCVRSGRFLVCKTYRLVNVLFHSREKCFRAFNVAPLVSSSPRREDIGMHNFVKSFNLYLNRSLCFHMNGNNSTVP